MLASTTNRDITVIGASAGGVQALRALLGALPADYPAAVFVVIHNAPTGSAHILPELLNRSSALSVTLARDGIPIVPGRALVAPPDRHLMLGPERVALSHGPRENHHRASIDVLFRSAAVAFGARVTGVILCGTLDDGSAGLWTIKQRGGRTVVQDPDDAEYGDMPRNAIAAARPDAVLPLALLPKRLLDYARERAPATAEPAPADMVQETKIAAGAAGDMAFNDAAGERTGLTCPECGGILWQMKTGNPRFRCHVGHAYSLGTLAADQSMRVEAALWAALRSLEEAERLSRQLAR